MGQSTGARRKLTAGRLQHQPQPPAGGGAAAASGSAALVSAAAESAGAAHCTVPVPPEPPVPPFGISRSQLFALNDGKDMDALHALGGAAGLARLLLCDLREGINDSHSRDNSAGAAAAAGAGADAAGDRSGNSSSSTIKSGGAAAASSGPLIAQRVEVFGANEMATVPLKSLLALIWDNLQDPILLLLIAAALVSTVLGAAIPEERQESGWVEGVAIWVAIAVVVLVSSFNDFSKDRQFAALNRQRDITDVTVVRGGAELRVRNTQVVVGDLLVLSAGDKVAADGLLAVPGLDRGGLLAADESSLTGESEAVKKSVDTDPWLRCGTQIQEGGGRMLVLAVGGDTEYGRTLAIVGSAGGEDTPLTEKLGHLASAIGKIGGAAAAVLFVVLMVIWMVRNRGFPIKKVNDNGPVQFFLYCVTIVVVAVPEGLPLAVTISLAYSMRQMMDDQCFVRVLEACETMGGCTAICSDKTGTLTQNRMTVVEGWLAPGTLYSRAPRASEVPGPLLDDLRRGIALNSRAFLVDPAATTARGHGGGGGSGGPTSHPGSSKRPPSAVAAAVAPPPPPPPPPQPSSSFNAAPSRTSSTSASVTAASRMTVAGSSVAGGGDAATAALTAAAAAPYGVDGLTGLEAAGDPELGLGDGFSDPRAYASGAASRGDRSSYGINGAGNGNGWRAGETGRGGGRGGGPAGGSLRRQPGAWHDERRPLSWLLRPWYALLHLCVGVVHCLPHSSGHSRAHNHNSSAGAGSAAGAGGGNAGGGRTASAVSDDGEPSGHDGGGGTMLDDGCSGGGACGGGGNGGVAIPPRIQMVGNRTECALLLLLDYGWRQQHQNRPHQPHPPHPPLDGGSTTPAAAAIASGDCVGGDCDGGGGGNGFGEAQSYDAMRRAYEAAGRLEHVYGFTSERKMSSVAVRLADGRLRLYTKGAAEWVLRACTSVQAADGRGTQPLDEGGRAALTRQVVDHMAGRGLRCIALAARDVPQPAPRRPAGPPGGEGDGGGGAPGHQGPRAA